MGEEGRDARGIFYTAGQGRNFRRRKRGGGDALQRFAEALSYHVTEEDVANGKAPAGTPVTPGGNPREAALRCGLNASSGNGMLQRIRKRLGPQAR